MRTRIVLTGALLVSSAFAQKPAVSNAQQQALSAAPGLEAVLNGVIAKQSAPAWIGYSVPVIPGNHNSCCYNNSVMTGCWLEGRHGESIIVAEGNRTVQLEGPTSLVVLFRVDNKQIDKIRTFSPECVLDAGGLPFFWVNDVRPADSIHYLAGIAKAGGTGVRDEERKADSVVGAIALHADPAADRVLDDFVALSQPEHLRRKTVFWLGTARGQHGVQTLTRVLRDDPSDKVRDQAVFGMTQSKEPGAMAEVIRIAHDDKSPHVRGQALFWLAQRAGRKVAGDAISDAIANDPETEVKKKAVFALTQMPSGEGVPLLIQVARTNRNAEVRKQAMFWLGQSRDSRALSFFEEVLK